MSIYADKTKGNKSQSVADEVSQKKNNTEPAFQFVDNRPEAIAQRKLQKMANDFSSRQQQVIQNKDKGMGLQDDHETGIHKIASVPVQRMAAYDSENIDLAEDPRHFSTSEIKNAIDACIENNSPVPSWLKEQVSGYLRDELLNRLNDMERHGGGDEGHQHYFSVVQDYVEMIDSLPVEEDDGNQVPVDGPVAQLSE